MTVHALGVPSGWVQRWAGLLAPGAAVLDVACGRGRHMAWLTGRGERVTGVDRDAVALAEAARWGQTCCSDIESDPWPLCEPDGHIRLFDAVLVCNYLWRPLWPTLRASVRPGGWLVYETFALGNERLGKPSRPDFLLQPGELLTLAAGWQVLAYEDGALRQPDRRVQRVVAQAPGGPRPDDLHWLE